MGTRPGFVRLELDYLGHLLFEQYLENDLD